MLIVAVSFVSGGLASVFIYVSSTRKKEFTWYRLFGNFLGSGVLSVLVVSFFLTVYGVESPLSSVAFYFIIFISALFGIISSKKEKEVE